MRRLGVVDRSVGSHGAVAVTTASYPSPPSTLPLAGGEKKLTIGEVNKRLDNLCKITTAPKRREWLMLLIRDCTAVEHKWIARIILKEVRIGLNEDRVLAFYHPDALEMCVCKSIAGRRHFAVAFAVVGRSRPSRLCG